MQKKKLQRSHKEYESKREKLSHEPIYQASKTLRRKVPLELFDDPNDLTDEQIQDFVSATGLTKAEISNLAEKEIQDFAEGIGFDKSKISQIKEHFAK